MKFIVRMHNTPDPGMIMELKGMSKTIPNIFSLNFELPSKLKLKNYLWKSFIYV
jgi:hypothetical protein